MEASQAPTLRDVVARIAFGIIWWSVAQVLCAGESHRSAAPWLIRDGRLSIRSTTTPQSY